MIAMALLDRMVFHPTRGGDPSPASLGIEAASWQIPTEDGLALHAYWLEAPDPARVPTVLFFHGNAGNASHRLPFAERLRTLGANVLLVDYRGYGLSEGSPSEPGLWIDARAGLAALAEREIPPERIVLFGRSLGGAVAVDLAQHHAFAAVVLESTFTNLADVARSYLGVGLDFWLASHMDSDRKIEALASPLLMIHGDDDRIVRIELGRALFDAAPEPKQLVVVPGGRHNDTWLVAGPSYFEHWQKLLEPLQR